MALTLPRIALSSLLLTTGCATLFAGKTDNIHLCPAGGAGGADIAVTDNGAATPTSPSNLQAVCPGGAMIEVDRRIDHTLQVTHAGKSATVQVGTGGATGWFLLDLFTTGPIGIIIDWTTHAWRSSTPVKFDLSP